MKLLFRFPLIVVFCIQGIISAEGKPCELPSKYNGNENLVNLNQELVSNMTGCTEWIGKTDFATHIKLEEGVEQDTFDQCVSTVRKIINVVQIDIPFEIGLERVFFPNLESVGSLKFLAISGKLLTNVSFPRLQLDHVVTLISFNVPKLSAEMKQQVENQFARKCIFTSPIDNVSLLSKCTKVNHLVFAEGTFGKVENVIESVDGEIQIVNTQLHDLDFLPDVTSDKKNQCFITGNRFCEYNTKMLRSSIRRNCRTKNNGDGFCDNNIAGEKSIHTMFGGILTVFACVMTI